MPNRSPQTLWETALGQLELQVTRPNFETWLRNTVGLRLDNNELVVGVPTDFALEWLRSRLSPLIARTVSQLVGVPVAVSFQVLGAQPTAASPSANGQTPQPASPALPPHLDPRFTFESFVPVKSNRLAYRAARRLASGDAHYSPLVLFGAPGLGKTHLLHAIGHSTVAAGRRVASLTGEAFVRYYTQTVRSGHPHSFRELFLSCNLLLLDDLRFLTTRAASQEQFFHIFNTLHAQGCLFALTTDTCPDDLACLSSPLRSRLQAGVLTELPPPSSEERLAIVRAKAARLPKRPPDSILQLLSEQAYDSIRELEGGLHQITAYAQLTGRPPSPQLALEALHPLRTTPLPPSPEAILRAVCTHFHISRQQLSSPSRARDVTYPRHVAMYLLRNLTRRPLNEIGQLLGGRDHSTVLSGYNRIKQERNTLPQTQADLTQLEQLLHISSAA